MKANEFQIFAAIKADFAKGLKSDEVIVSLSANYNISLSMARECVTGYTFCQAIADKGHVSLEDMMSDK